MPKSKNDSNGLPAKTAKSERTRAAILTAAQELFAEFGYERATVRDVAARAAIDPAMVMRYFGSKDEVALRARPIQTLGGSALSRIARRDLALRARPG